MPRSRIPALALAADVVAVVVFVAVGRINHAGSADLLGLLGTAAPFLAGLAAVWSAPIVRVDPAGLRAGAVVVAGTAGVGLVLRLAFTGDLPPTFAAVTAVSLAVLMLGWRALSLVVARRAAHRVT
ncbi:DUF3054 domain-containing protein [Pseudonocardia sp.]|uniref:DUF3054 domain-containing protein n=1 Tax=Pseudonocardia sp. TaxID=60912 RepID=UPI002624322B|nr:DUF3054 domain-containing protein [Pseudonocardia sp.]